MLDQLPAELRLMIMSHLTQTQLQPVARVNRVMRGEAVFVMLRRKTDWNLFRFRLTNPNLRNEVLAEIWRRYRVIEARPTACANPQERKGLLERLAMRWMLNNNNANLSVVQMQIAQRPNTL